MRSCDYFYPYEKSIHYVYVIYNNNENYVLYSFFLKKKKNTAYFCVHILIKS